VRGVSWPAGPPLGQHFLRSERLAADLVTAAGVGPGDLVVEVGAGSGVLTAALAERARQVWAIEVDGRLAASLAGRFAGAPHVVVIPGDALEIPLPAGPYRVVANPPFAMTTALLRRLFDDPAAGPWRADLVVQWQVARARAQGTDALGARWAPWWEFRRGRRIPARLFRRPPSVEAAVLVAERRGARATPARGRTTRAPGAAS